MNTTERSLFKRAAREAVKRTTVISTDTDRDILGKIFNHFHQSLREYTVEGWEASNKIPRRMKKFATYSSEIDMYVAKLLATALEEVKRTKIKDDFKILRESLCFMRVVANEAKRVSETSSMVVNQLRAIERDMNNG